MLLNTPQPHRGDCNDRCPYKFLKLRKKVLNLPCVVYNHDRERRIAADEMRPVNGRGTAEPFQTPKDRSSRNLPNPAKSHDGFIERLPFVFVRFREMDAYQLTGLHR